MKDGPALFRYAGFQKNLHMIAACRRVCCKRDAGIAARLFDDGIAFLERPVFLCPQDHIQGGSVLDASRRIQVFELEQKMRRGVFFLFISKRFQQRRAACQLCDTLIDFTHIVSFQNISY